MAFSPFFSSFSRRRKSLAAGVFFPGRDLSDVDLVRTLASLAGEVCSSVKASAPFQRRNSRSLISKVKIFLSLFEFLRDSFTGDRLPSSATLCFKEIHILLGRSKNLLVYCAQSSRIWLLLQSVQISGQFHDLNQEISTLLDVLPLGDLALAADVQEQIELLQRQARRSKLFLDPREEALLRRIYAFIDELDKGRSPDLSELREVFVDGLAIREASACKAEVDFLEQICNEEEVADISFLHSVVALARYARFSLFGFDADAGEISGDRRMLEEAAPPPPPMGPGDAVPPKEFCCPISLDLMRDPVIVCTGQTYDRSSIVRWMNEGHSSCPNSGQPLRHSRLQGRCGGQPRDGEAPSGAALVGGDAAKTVAARELRLLAKNGGENRASIAEAGAIPLLRRLLSSPDPAAQENSVTAILNLSILEKNKSQIMAEPGCLSSIVEVLISGRTTEARENAAATLFSLSAVHDYKKMISSEEGAVEALTGLLREGSQRGKKDAVTALFNISTHCDCCERMIQSGATTALVAALAEDAVAEEAAGALALLMRQPAAAAAIGREEAAVPRLAGLMGRGTPRAKEYAVAALLELCRCGGGAMTEKVARAPALGALLQTLLFTGTKRARRKAASLAKLCQRCQLALDGGWALEYALSRSSSIRRSRNFGRGDVSVSVPVSISVPVL
ncbi:unnamed protein product [Spirodela intermedia]|uniref:RING-type E3 ubiquitin transferase n=1 Tax=Spirodela intermedia TaxID=51605 RepID=A0A7I8IT01_SPIIN|nr:unnamed protein product [Spirodela intermedia]CAA6661141.1 unnamed protein product [Spirodela intermedia]